MFSKILFPISGEILSKEDMAIAIDLAKKYNGTIHLLTVSEIYLGGLTDLTLPDEILKQHKQLIEDYLKKYAKIFQEENIDVEIHIREGLPYREIVDFAEELKVGLIIIPTHGRKGLPAFILGSVAQKVVKFAKCPVLTFIPKFVKEYINE